MAWKWTCLSVVSGLATLGVLLYPLSFRSAGDEPWLALRAIEPLIVGAHVALFVPLGFAEARLVTALFGGRLWALPLVVIDAAGLALIAETAQMWMVGRHSSLVDLVACVLGAAVGAWWGLLRVPGTTR